MDLLRAAVSGKRRRLRLPDGSSLDISYITPRLLAMSFPASRVEALYRNEIGSVARFLEAAHGAHFLVVNLSERAYDYSLFGHRVVECGFADHHTAPLGVLIDICRATDAWLAGGAERVVVVHCLAGKGRTGVACASYLVYSGAVAGEAAGVGGARRWGAADGGAAGDTVRGRAFLAATAAAGAVELAADADAKEEGESADEVTAGEGAGACADEGAVGDDEVDDDDEDEDDDAPGDGNAVDSDEDPEPASTRSAAAESAATTMFAPLSPTSPLEAEAEATAAARFGVPSAEELAERAVRLFLQQRGEGLSFAAQRRSVLYVATVVRRALIGALAHSLSDSAATAAEADDVRHWDRALAELHGLQLPPPPKVRVLAVVLHSVPLMRSTRNLRPSLQLRAQPHQDLRGVAVLADTRAAADSVEALRVYEADDVAVAFRVDTAVAGDILLRVVHHRLAGDARAEGGAEGAVRTAVGAAVGAAAGALGRGGRGGRDSARDEVEVFRLSFHVRLRPRVWRARKHTI
jgi:hypothetical protein